jgi:uncharacterized membrane protein YuzA (DUF378 family)
MNKYVKYTLIGVTGIIVALALVKAINKKREPILDEEMDALLKKIDEAKK